MQNSCGSIERNLKTNQNQKAEHVVKVSKMLDKKLKNSKVNMNPRPSIEPKNLGTLETYDDGCSEEIQIFNNINTRNAKNDVRKSKNLKQISKANRLSRSFSRKQILNQYDNVTKNVDEKNVVPMKFSKERSLSRSNNPLKEITNASNIKQNVHSNRINTRENIEVINKKAKCKKTSNNNQNQKTGNNHNFGKSLTNRYTSYCRQDVIEVYDESSSKLAVSAIKPKYDKKTNENVRKARNSSSRGLSLNKRSSKTNINKENCSFEQSNRGSVYNENSCKRQNLEGKNGYQEVSVERKSISSKRNNNEKNMNAKNQQNLKNNQKNQNASCQKLELTKNCSVKSINTANVNPNTKTYT